MKKTVMLLLFVICFCGLVGCGEDVAPEVKIDYGNSAIYSREDMDEAIKLIKDKFGTWDGCELHSISYSSDDKCNNSENIAWVNELAEANDYAGNFTQCIMFKSNFHSPENGGGAWRADEEYTEWQWWLARTEKSSWKLITWGY